MVRLLDRAGLTRLSHRLALLPLAVHKGVLRARRLADDHGGTRRAERRGQEWATTWESAFGSMDTWLRRPGAGQLWVGPESGARWARRTTTRTDVEQAEAVLAGRIPLLGAEPERGHPPRWLRDGYTGAEWPLEPAGNLPLARGDGSDIRTIWELSRCYHFVALARAFWRTGDPRFVTGFREQAESWLAANPAGLGPNWVSPLDVAIRGANWALAAVILARAPGLPARFWAGYLASLRIAARHIRRNLEWHPVYRGNHYISNAVGLVYLGALFRDDPEGDGWLRTGAAILRREMDWQVHPDGVCFEGSIGYHRLVTEFFTWGGAVVQRNLPTALPPAWWRRLGRMRGFIEAYLDAEGRAPLVGDADDGRLHHLCAEAARHPRRHRAGLRPSVVGGSPPSAAFPAGGFYLLRNGRDRCIVRCGPVGLAGAGSHDHNDQLAVELSLDGRDLITDSGTFAYTRDLARRFAFRSVQAHTAVQVGNEEPNPIVVGRPWRVLADRTRSRCDRWHSGPEGTRFEGHHRGYTHRPSGAVVHRSVAVDAGSSAWEILDRVDGQGAEEVTWRLHLAPGAIAAESSVEGAWSFRHEAAPDHRFLLEAPAGLALEWGESAWSETYGVSVMRPMLSLRGRVALPIAISLQIVRAAAPGGRQEFPGTVQDSR